jgi:thiamine-monophosphate kinase
VATRALPGPASLSLTAIGEVAAGMEVRRSGAQPGDLVWVSGTIGDSFLGLRARGGAYPELPAEHRAAVIARFQVPDPRVELGPRLAGIAHAMIDVSDGLLADVGHICETSRVAAVASWNGSTSPQRGSSLPAIPAALSCRGGGDYELLFSTL